MPENAVARLPRRLPLVLAALVGSLLAFATPARAQDPASDFRQNCSSCHTIGGGQLVGPDLKNVSERREHDWLVDFIVDPASMLDGGDPVAARLLAEYRTRMPNVPGMSEKRAELLLELIERESQLEKSQFAGLEIPDRPFTAEDVQAGRRYFVGLEPLEAGGASCISCHHVGGLGGFGGGRLGPDLTRVYERYETRRKLASWLTAPATPTMQPTFRDHPLVMEEILPLVAYFEHAAREQQEGHATSIAWFLVLGLVASAGVLAVGGRVWDGRLRGVRRPLVETSQARRRRDPTRPAAPGEDDERLAPGGAHRAGSEA